MTCQKKKSQIWQLGSEREFYKESHPTFLATEFSSRPKGKKSFGIGGKLFKSGIAERGKGQREIREAKRSRGISTLGKKMAATVAVPKLLSLG